jgi:hypothetical protein
MPAAPLEAAYSAEYFFAFLTTLRRSSLIAPRFDETFGSESVNAHTPTGS